jgi:hypothetical protein
VFYDKIDPEQSVFYYRLKVLSEKSTVLAISNVAQVSNTSLEDIKMIYTEEGILFKVPSVTIRSVEVFGLDGVLWFSRNNFDTQETLMIPKYLIHGPVFYCRIITDNETYVRKVGWRE